MLKIKKLNNLKNFLKEIYLKHAFNPSWHSVFINPYFIARFFLYRNIKYIVKKYDLENQKVLDVGCGIQPYRHLFKDKYLGIDIQGGGHNDSMKKADLYFNGENIPFSNESFDLIFCTQVLEHSYNFDNLLKEMHRVLKKNGYLLITTPFVWNEHEVPFDFYRFTQFFYRSKGQELNLDLIEIKSTCGFWATIGQLISAFVIENIDKVFKNKLIYLFLSLILCAPIQIFFLFLNFIFLNNNWLNLDYIVLFKKSS